jgi:SAM-dependent methyltransferase
MHGPSQPDGYVSDTPYLPSFTHELAPAWLDHVALLSGVQPPDRRDGFAWCDLGCGYGLTTAVFAATHPAGYFHGVDMMPEHIEQARLFAAESAITNIAFHIADFANASQMGLPGFDYIVAHGVYSWVDANGQATLRHFIDRHLRPGGLVYVSYNAMPGRAADVPFQRLVRALGRTLPGDSAAACVAAIDIVGQLMALNPPALLASAAAVALKKPKQQQQPKAYLAHEYMTANWNPLCVTDVRAAMREIGLVPVGSATLIENHDVLTLKDTALVALQKIVDPDVREFARDFFINQSFRRDVFVRAGGRLDDATRRRRLMASTFALLRPAGGIEYALESTAGRVTFDGPVTRRIVDRLVAGPSSLAAIAAEAALAEPDVLTAALVLAAADVAVPVEPGGADVEGINRAIRRRLGGPEEILRLALPCGTALPLGGALLRLIGDNDLVRKGELAEWADFLRSAHGLQV